jgi:hypothetical protein
MSRDEVVASFRKPRKTDARAQATGNTLRRVIPIIVAQQIVEEQGARSVNVPVEAHILAVADAYQKLISGADGKLLSPAQAERNRESPARRISEAATNRRSSQQVHQRGCSVSDDHENQPCRKTPMSFLWIWHYSDSFLSCLTAGAYHNQCVLEPFS